METKTPRIPQEIIDKILDHLSTIDPLLEYLPLCALVSKSWVSSCRRHLFRTATFTPEDMAKWLKMFPVPEEGPAHHVRDLRFTTGWNRFPQRPLEYISWFTNVERVDLLLYGGPRSQAPSLGRLPQSIISLTLDTDAITLLQIRDIMTQLPNLDNLSLSGSPAEMGRNASQGLMGAAPIARFRGQLELLDRYAREDVINMLLEVPTGLWFTEIEIRGWNVHLPSAASLAEVCRKTLVKLAYGDFKHGKSHPFLWSSRFQRVRCYS